MIFKELLAEIEGGRILDVGCGSGQFTEIFTGALKSYDRYTGIDVAGEYLAEAREKFPGPDMEFIQASSQDLPFEDESFDLVAISKALHHVEDPVASLEEMKRVLKHGGYFFINEMHRDGLSDSQASHMMYHHLRSEIDNALGISHHHTFYREDLIGLVDGLGLQDRVVLEFSPDDTKAKDPENIIEFVTKMEEWFLSLDGHKDREKFLRRAEELKIRFRQYGISRPPQLVFLGRKIK